MPPDHGVRLDDDERASPAGPEATEPRPEQPVDGSQPRSPVRVSLQDRQLLPQRGVLLLERGPALSMHDWRSLAHVRWECKYHVVIIPKFRRKILYGQLRKRVGRILRELCDQRGVELIEGKAMADHVHLCLSIPPKYSVAHTIGFLKGKSAVRIHRNLLRERRMTGLHF